jgi:hypothetical protein
MKYLLVPELAGEEMNRALVGSEGRHHFRSSMWKSQG